MPACTDADGDGVCAPSDCDDTDATVHPGAAETCDGRDEDCDGVVDDGCTMGCAAGLTLCGASCVDLRTNESNCGSCGAACAMGSTCSSGVCG